MKRQKHIDDIAKKWVGICYDAQGKPYVGIVSSDIAQLLLEIDLLTEALEGMRRMSNGKSVGADSKGWKEY